ncbi:MAG: ATP-binding protein, partial [Anaerolineae bacterium]|nr:ATP-binding protein [Anaerolineae bacterium]
DPAIRRTFLRIAQESMANVVKHAKADQATIAVVIEDKEAILLVVDNGQGIDPHNLEVEDDDHHFGLLGMHDRLARLGGALAINHRCDRGTTVKATLPLDHKELQRA